MGDKMLDKETNSEYLVKLEKNATDTIFTKCYGKFMNRMISRIYALSR